MVNLIDATLVAGSAVKWFNLAALKVGIFTCKVILVNPKYTAPTLE